MAIYLDANVLWSWRTFRELNRVAIAIVSSQLRQRVAMPDLAFEEATWNFRRDIEYTHGRWQAAGEAMSEAFAHPLELSSEPWPDPEWRIDQWREQLLPWIEILVLDPVDAVEALGREIRGEPPARRLKEGHGKDKAGTGARDAAIWLTIVRDHRSRNEPGYFISRDQVFGRSNSLSEALASELVDALYPLSLYSSASEFLTLLGEADDSAEVSLDTLAERVPRTLRVVLPVTSHVPTAVFGTADSARYAYHVTVKEAVPQKVTASRRYHREGEGLTVVDSEWSLVIDCFRQLRESDSPTASGWEEVVVEGPIQLYLPDNSEEPAQLISARFTTPGQLLVSGEDEFSVLE